MAYIPLTEAPALGEALHIRRPLDPHQPLAMFPVGTRVYLKAGQSWADMHMDQRVEGWIWCEDRGHRVHGDPDLDWTPFVGAAHIDVERETDVPVSGAPPHLPSPAVAILGEAVLVVGAQREHPGPASGLSGRLSLDPAHQADAHRWNKVAVVMEHDGQTWLLERASLAPVTAGGLSIRASDLPGAAVTRDARKGRKVSVAHAIQERYAGGATPSVGCVGRLSGLPRDWRQAGLYGRVPVVFDGKDLGYLHDKGTPVADREVTRYLDPRCLRLAPIQALPRPRPRTRR